MSTAALETTQTQPRTATKQQAPHSEENKPNWFARIVLVLVCVAWSVPTIGLLVTSFRPIDEINAGGWWSAILQPWNNTWGLQNYGEVLNDNDMGTAFVNSLVVAIPATVIPVLFAAVAAYAFTFMQFRGRDTLFLVVVGLLVIPLQVAFVPMLQLFGRDGFDIIGQFVVVWLLHTGFGMPLAIYILRNYMVTLPRTVIESAQIDGASHYQTFWRLIVPMSTPALAAFAIFQFLWVWNDLLIALLFLGSDVDSAVVTVTLSQLVNSQGDGWHLLTAGAFVSMAVPLLVFISLQRFFVRGLTAGSVKG
ncbi:carbohydrate ABC transporter permease [soil metagenome]